MRSNVLGLDLSLRATGMASVFTDDDGSLAIRTRTLKNTKRGHARLEWIIESIALAVPGHDIVGVEGLSNHSKGSSFLDLAGLHWQVRHRLWKMGVPYVVVSPAVRMKYVTGKGGGPQAEKTLVWQAAQRRWPQSTLQTNDEADALIVAAVTARVARDPFDELPDLDHFSPVNSMQIIRE